MGVKESECHIGSLHFQNRIKYILLTYFNKLLNLIQRISKELLQRIKFIVTNACIQAISDEEIREK